MDAKYLVMLNSVYDNGDVAEIIAAGLVPTLEEGEFWFNNNKPVDGTDVDYTIYELRKIREWKKG